MILGRLLGGEASIYHIPKTKGSNKPQLSYSPLVADFSAVRPAIGTYVRHEHKFFCCLPTSGTYVRKEQRIFTVSAHRGLYTIQNEYLDPKPVGESLPTSLFCPFGA